MFFIFNNHNFSSKFIKYSLFVRKIAIFDQFVESITLPFVVAKFTLKKQLFFDVIVDRAYNASRCIYSYNFRISIHKFLCDLIKYLRKKYN